MSTFGFMLIYECMHVCVCVCVQVYVTSIALTHIQRDLAARDTLPIMFGWKSACLQYWPTFFNTLSDILSLSKWTNVLMKFESPARNKSKTHRSENQEKRFWTQLLLDVAFIWLYFWTIISTKGKHAILFCTFVLSTTHALPLNAQQRTKWRVLCQQCV